MGRYDVPPVQRPRNRDYALQKAFFGDWPGTLELGARLHQESLGWPKSWQPVRSAMAHAVDACEVREDRVWMTFEQLSLWRREQRAADSAADRPRGSADAAIGITRRKLQDIREGTRKVRKHVAMAAAHYTLRFPLPVQPDAGPEAITAWFLDRFGAAQPVYTFLEVGQAYLNDRIRGFTMTEGARKDVDPTEPLIRALDWLDRVGPVCPFSAEPMNTFPKET